jgi:parvulin-like peptidyl-prolyl isomerase
MPRLLRTPSLPILAVVLSICLWPSPRGRAADADSDVVAKVGDTQMTAADIRAAIQNLDANTQAAIARDPSTLPKVVRAILAERLVLKEAQAKKWDQDPSVAATLARLRDTAIAQTYLQAVSKPPDSYPSDADLEQAYDANKAKLLVPRQLDLAQIYIRDPKGADDSGSPKAELKLDAVKKALARRDADFAAIATADSDDTASAAKGGDLGWLSEGRIEPAIRSQLGSLTKGAVSQPIRLNDGWHVLKVNDVKEPYTPSLDEVRSALRARMRQERAQVNSQQYLAKLLQDNPVEINELSLSKVLKQQP